MSRQLSLSATFSAFTLAVFALVMRADGVEPRVSLAPAQSLTSVQVSLP